MCDTLLALPAFTARGATLFAKNSDRERNEAQGLELHQAAKHSEGSPLRLTYITVPQVVRTHACLISRPFWMWGAEMGANEHGVVIGNEAVHSIVPPEPGKALIGMDLVRLGLERASTAEEAVTLITRLLERHGQAGDCGHLEPFHYHNSFMVADEREAFVLETVGRWWAVERVTATRAISNVLSIGPGGPEISLELQSFARSQGWLTAGGGLDFADRLADFDKDGATRGIERMARTRVLLRESGTALTIGDAMNILRDHGPAARLLGWSPADIVGRTLCMHAGGGDRRSQTVAAMVSELRSEGGVHWVTASSAPCLSVFKPVTFSSGLPPQGSAPSDRHDDGVGWWRHEQLHRAALFGYASFIADFAPWRDALESDFRTRIDRAINGDGDVGKAVEDCWRDADAFESEWGRRIGDARVDLRGDYRESWATLSQLARMPEAAHRA